MPRTETFAAEPRRPSGWAGWLWRLKLMRFGLVGLAAAATDLALFWLFNQTWGWHRLAAQGVSRPSGGAVSFLCNKHWTFRRPGAADWRQQARRFVAVWAASFVLSTILLQAYRRLLPTDARFDFLAKLLAEGTAGLANFLLHRFWTFR